MTTRRSFLTVLGGLVTPGRRSAGGRAPVIDARPTALYQQPDGRRNLVRITVSGLSAPAARARVLDRRGALVGTAGLLPDPDRLVLAGEVGVPLSEPATYRIDVEVGRDRLARRSVRLVPPRRWTLFLLSSIHTDVGYTDLQERCLEIHRQNLDAALARLSTLPHFRWTPECALHVLSYVENRSAEAADALVRAIRDGQIGFQALFANMLTGILDHETLARVIWPAGLFARERGLGYIAAQITDVPGQVATFPTVLAASGVRYLASGANPERAVPLLPRAEAERHGLAGEWPAYPQLYWWEGPDGSRVLHWRAHHYGDARRLGFAEGPAEMGRRLSDWLLEHPVLLSPAWPYDVALLYGLDWQDNAPVNEVLISNVEDFNRRYAFPRIVPGRAEDFFRHVERRYGAQLPVRRGDTGTYWEDGAASTAAELALFRGAQLAARAAEILALWDERAEPQDAAAAARRRRRATDRRAMWRELLLFGEHTWGAAVSVSQPEARQTIAQWAYKRRYLESAWAAAQAHVHDGLLRIGRGTDPGRGRLVFNAAGWDRTDVARIPGGAGKALSHAGRELPAVDLVDGSALVVVRDVPALGYLALREQDRGPRPPVDEGSALDAATGGFRVRLDPATGAIASLSGPDGRERVNPSAWSGLNQLVYVTGGAGSAMWTAWDRGVLRNAPRLRTAGAALVATRRERLPGIGTRLTAERRLDGFPSLVSIVTLYDDLPWIDIENRLVKTATLEKEALYVAFPFAATEPTVDLEIPLGRMMVERDQQPGACRDWYCHAHWVRVRAGAEGGDGGGILWSGPDTPLVTFNDLFRGAWRRRLVPDGTLFAYVMNNYWHTNYAARQGGELVVRFRVSLVAADDAAEPARRGWAACDPLYVSAPYDNPAAGPLISRDRALVVGDRGVLVLAAKPADDGDGAVVRLLDVAGTSRAVGIWPAAWTFERARRTNLVEMNQDPIPIGVDRRATVDLRAWGVASVRLFTPREGAG